MGQNLGSFFLSKYIFSMKKLSDVEEKPYASSLNICPKAWCSVGCLLSTEFRAGIFKHSIGARNRVGIGLSYRPARHSLESIPGLHKR